MAARPRSAPLLTPLGPRPPKSAPVSEMPRPESPARCVPAPNDAELRAAFERGRLIAERSFRPPRYFG